MLKTATSPIAWTAKPITPHIGAVLSGVRLSGEPNPAMVAAVSEAIADHLMLVIEDQDLSATALRNCVSQFGPLFRHHHDEAVILADGLPEVLEMRKEPDGIRLFGGSDWHADVTFRRPAGHLSFLHAKVLPPVGGDTGFASTIAAFEALSEGLQEMLRGLNAVHSYNGPDRPDHPTETAVHPVVRRHPDTGQEGLYINRMFATRFERMTADESRPLIEFLDRHISRPEFSTRIHWKPGQMTIWDNRFTLHYPINDFTGHQRLLLRCSTMETA